MKELLKPGDRALLLSEVADSPAFLAIVAAFFPESEYKSKELNLGIVIDGCYTEWNCFSRESGYAYNDESLVCKKPSSILYSRAEKLRAATAKEYGETCGAHPCNGSYPNQASLRCVIKNEGGPVLDVRIAVVGPGPAICLFLAYAIVGLLQANYYICSPQYREEAE